MAHNQREQRDGDRIPTIVGYLIAQQWFTILLLAMFTAAWLLEPWAGILLLIALAAPAPIREPLLQRLRGDMLRLRWTLAVIKSGAADPPPDRSHRHRSHIGPRPTRATMVPVGDILTLRSRQGFIQLERSLPHLAAELGVREVQISRHPHRANRATATLIRRDAWTAGEPLEWPWHTHHTVSVWDTIPVGIDERHHPIGINLVERNMLVGGLPGAGKTVMMSLIAAATALDPNAHLWAIDMKKVDTTVWQPSAQAIATDKQQAVEVLRELNQVMRNRLTELDATGQEKITRDSGLPPHVLIVDELADLVVGIPNNEADQKLAQEAATLLRKITQLGRAAGVISVLATQFPHSSIIDTTLRDLLGFRVAFRAATRHMSDTILGPDWAAQGYNAQRIPSEQKGVAWLLTDGDVPLLIKGYMLTRTERQRIADRAASNRIDIESATLLTPPPATEPPQTGGATTVLEPRAATTPASQRYDPEDASALLNLLADRPWLRRDSSPESIEAIIGKRHKTWHVALRVLVADGDIVRTGSGRRGNPYRYAIRGAQPGDERAQQ